MSARDGRCARARWLLRLVDMASSRFRDLLLICKVERVIKEGRQMMSPWGGVHGYTDLYMHTHTCEHNCEYASKIKNKKTKKLKRSKK